MGKAKKEILKKIAGAQLAQILGTACRLKLFDRIGVAGATPEELSASLKVELSLLKRFLAALEASDLLSLENGTYFLTEESLYLTSAHPHSLQDVALFKTHPFIWASLGALQEGLLTATCPFEVAHKEDLFSYLSQNEEAMRTFQNAMSTYEALSSKQILSHLNLREGQVVADIGGGMGSFLLSILERYPVQGILFDLPDVIEAALLKNGENNRLTLTPGSFFDSVPKADVYLLRNILHDWSDERCIDLLTVIRHDCPQDSVLYLFETLIEEGSRLGRFSDLSLFLMTSGGKERSEEEFRRLAERSGFECSEVIRASGSKVLIQLIPN